MKTRKGSKNDGTFTQDKVQKALIRSHSRGESMVCRVYDTHSAGRMLPKVAGDFIGVFQGHPVLIECKSSEKRFKTFNRAACKALTKNHQIACSQMWTMAGGLSLFIFYSFEADVTEFRVGPHVVEMYKGEEEIDEKVTLQGSSPEQIDAVLAHMFSKIERKED